jgi:hypothetical protein
MPLLATRHAAFETGSQIGVTNFVQSGDDLLLVDICHFHFMGCRHAGIYVGGSAEPIQHVFGFRNTDSLPPIK